ncbi:hypothetical protein FA15DRAFT_366961 [Coprinopsis marcescibilis]|uniref:F-box domain-containing protein n=1 Tax=Coprinopsis marcescibilis TaxID=230819 RepID=A0A5C3KYC2_COPMA|nr:hypothetical protein FA15DRAFT_366961 [Coprinopsis marcescibilis]
MYPPHNPVYQRILGFHPYPLAFSKPPSHQLARRESSQSSREAWALLPAELWAEVFLYCIQTPQTEGTPMWYSRELAIPMLLCQICRSWRQIALSFSQLWQRLTVCISMGKSYPSFELASIWIARSGTLPLSLSLYQQNESNLNRLVTGRMLALFMKHMPRWMDIDFRLAGPRLSNSLFPEHLGAPLLRRFNVRTNCRVYEREEKDIFGVFQEVPRLTHLEVSRIPELDLLGNSIINVPWAQLETLSMDYVPSVGTSLHILSKCHSISACEMKIDSLFGPIFDSPLCHSRLLSLSISVSFEHFPGLLTMLTLPALRYLKVHVRGPLEQYGWPETCFEQFLERSSCKLTRLEVHDSGMRVDQFVGLLSSRKLQGLNALVVEDRRDWTWDPFVTDIALELLHCPLYKDNYTAIVVLGGASIGGDSEHAGGRTCFLPNLTQLVVRGNCLRTSDGVIASMVETRWYQYMEGVAQLESVKLDIPSNHFRDLQRLKTLQAKGLDLELTFIDTL